MPTLSAEQERALANARARVQAIESARARQPRDLLAEQGADGTYRVSPQEAEAELNRRRAARGEGPWTRYQDRATGTRYPGRPVGEDGPWRRYQKAGSNPFDQFDAPAKTANPFDRFDAPASSAQPQHYEFDPRNVPGGLPGYDPATGEVAPAPLAGTGPMDKVGAFTGGFIDGIPIAGPLMKKGMAAGFAGLISPFTDKTFGEEYRSALDVDRAAQEANPITSTVGSIGGAVAGTLPMIYAAPTAFGAGGGPLLARTGASTLSGAGIGAADAAVRSGGDIEAIERGALWGGATGVAGPVVGDAIGAGIRGAANMFRPNQLPGVPRGAQRAFLRAAGDDGLDAATAAARLQQLGPDAVPMDLGPNLRRQAAALAAEPGAAQRTIMGTVTGRDAGANARILSELDATLGPAGVPSQIDDALRSGQQSLSPLYQDVLRDARAVQTQPIADALDSALVTLRGDAQNAVRRVRRMLNVTGTNQLDPDPATLLAVRQAIDDMMPNLGGNAGRVIGDVRRSIDGELARAAPGIKEVDARFAEIARQRDALAAGGRVFDTGREAMRPAELAQEFAGGAAPRGQMVGPSAAPLRLRQGARAELDRIVGTSANDRVKLQNLIAGEGDWNPQKLATMFGQDRASRILNVLDRERAFAETSNAIRGSSETAARVAARGEIAPPEGFSVRDLAALTALGGAAGGGWGAAAGAATKLGDRGVKAVANAWQASRNRALGEVLSGQATGRGAASPREAILALLLQSERSRAPMSPAIQRVARALLAGPGTTQSQNLPAIPFAGAR